MNFDALTLAAVRSEIEDRALGGRVQRVASPKPGALALEIYGQQERRYLLLDVDPDKPRVRFAGSWPRAGTQAASPLLLLARKWVRGARLVEIAQPPAERILELVFEVQGPEMREAVRTRRSWSSSVVRRICCWWTRMDEFERRCGGCAAGRGGDGFSRARITNGRRRWICRSWWR